MAAAMKVQCITSNRKFDFINRCVFTIYVLLLCIHPDHFWNDGALGFFEEVASTRRRTTPTRWLAIWSQFL